MAEPKSETFSVLLQPSLRRLLDEAAERRFTDASEYLRQAAVDRLMRDGVLPEAR